MEHPSILFSMFLIFTGAAFFATAALYTRQSLLVAYIFLGWCIGPSGFGWVADHVLLSQIANIGIMFLLFLLGLNLHPQNLIHMLKNTVAITIASSLSFTAIGFIIASFCGFNFLDSLIIGLAMLFSSTIIGLKLLPTTVLHHQRTGEVVISILLLQDLIAIVILLLLNVDFSGGEVYFSLLSIALALPAITVGALAVSRFILVPLIARFDGIQEYIFLLAIGWCLGLAQLAESLGLSYEIGAFIGGVALASSPIALYISESLKPLRDFFLILFFFSLGAGFDVSVLADIWLPTLLIASLLLLIKPLLFWAMLRRTHSAGEKALEIGVRLGQVSEFSLLVAIAAYEAGKISLQASSLIQATVVITFVASSYYIVMKYPTPIALSEKMRRN